jgi:hypothetical protein
VLRCLSPFLCYSSLGPSKIEPNIQAHRQATHRLTSSTPIPQALVVSERAREQASLLGHTRSHSCTVNSQPSSFSLVLLSLAVRITILPTLPHPTTKLRLSTITISTQHDTPTSNRTVQLRTTGNPLFALPESWTIIRTTAPRIGCYPL